MFEHESQNHIPEFTEVTDAYQEIFDHNYQHSGWRVIFGGMFNAMAEQVDHTGEDIEAENLYEIMSESIQEKRVEGDMHGDLIEIMHDDLFSRLGIKILPAGSRIVGGGNEEASTSAGLVPFIVNTSLYSDFLKTIDPEQAGAEGGGKLLVDTARNLKRLIDGALGNAGEYEGMNDEEQALMQEVGAGALRTWSEIENDYMRLGFSADVLRVQLQDPDKAEDARRKLGLFGNLEQYVEYWGKGLLPEFIEASNEGYIVPSEEYHGWHPARWAEDMSPHELTEKWETAMNFIAELKDKAGAGELATHARENLSTALGASIDSMRAGEARDEEAYQRDLAEWRAHGEQPYKDPKYPNLNVMIKRAPNKDAYTYYRKNRIALQAAKLRFDQL